MKVQLSHTKSRSGILPGMLLLLLFFSCQNHIEKDTSAPQISVVDFSGKTVELQQPAERVVCLIESALSGLYMIGAGNSVCGISTNIYNGNVFTHYAEMDERIRMKTLQAPGNWDFVSIESVIALKPDLVIIWASQTESITAIENAGIPVYAVMLKSFSDVYREISDLGKLTGKNSRADSLISWVQDEVNDMKSRVSGLPSRKKVYFMWAQGPLETSGKNSTVNEMLEAAGTVNACPYDDEHLTVNIENIIGWNPDVIVMWENEQLDPEDILGNPAWQSLNAVKNGEVFELPPVFYCDFWTLKFPLASAFLMNKAYPERLPDSLLGLKQNQFLKQLYKPE